MTKRGPWTFDEAMAASEEAHDEQLRVSQEDVVDAYREYAQKERLYKVALVGEMTRLKASGHAITACETMAKGDERIAELRHDRDIAEGLKKAAEQAAWCANADRKDVSSLIDWSKRRDLADGYGNQGTGGPTPIIYGKRAA